MGIAISACLSKKRAHAPSTCAPKTPSAPQRRQYHARRVGRSFFSTKSVELFHQQLIPCICRTRRVCTPIIPALPNVPWVESSLQFVVQLHRTLPRPAHMIRYQYPEVDTGTIIRKRTDDISALPWAIRNIIFIRLVILVFVDTVREEIRASIIRVHGFNGIVSLRLL